MNEGVTLMSRLSYQSVKREAFKKNPKIKAAYDALQNEFALNRQLLKARKNFSSLLLKSVT